MNVAETYACEMIDSATGRMLDVNVVGGDDIPVNINLGYRVEMGRRIIVIEG